MRLQILSSQAPNNNKTLSMQAEVLLLCEPRGNVYEEKKPDPCLLLMS